MGVVTQSTFTFTVRMPTLVPTDLSDVTATWVQEALAAACPGGTVDALEMADVSFGSACRARLLLTGDGVPAQLLLKASFTQGLGDDDLARQWLQVMAALNLAELRFYAEHADALGSRAPRCYWSGESDGVTVLLLEDLSLRQASFGRFDEPRTPEAQAGVLDALARLHAAQWDAGGLRTNPIPDGMVEGGMLQGLLSEPNWQQQEIRSRWARVPASLNNRDTVADAITRLWASRRSGPQVLLHGDPHIANTFADAEGAGLLDFQLFTSGHWASDVVYATASALTIEDRRAHERDLLAGYLQALTKYGAAAPTWDEAWLAYRRFSLWGFVVLLTPGEGVQSEEYNTVVGERHAVAAVDLGALDALGS